MVLLQEGKPIANRTRQRRLLSNELVARTSVEINASLAAGPGLALLDFNLARRTSSRAPIFLTSSLLLRALVP
jgi:hypothetical protein